MDERNDPVGDAMRLWSRPDEWAGAAPVLRLAGVALCLVAIALVCYVVLDQDTYGQTRGRAAGASSWLIEARTASSDVRR